MNDNYIHGDWNAVCDICGFKYKASQLRPSGDLSKKGLMVCKSCYDPLHPQDLLRGREDDPSVPWSRPDVKGSTSSGTNINGDSISTPVVSGNNGDENVALTSSSSKLQAWETSFTQNRYVTISTAGASEGDTFTLTKTQNDGYSLYVGGSVKSTGTTTLTAVGYIINLPGGTFVTDGVIIGDYATNINTGAYTTVSSVDSETALTTTDLYTFSAPGAGEEYIISSGGPFVYELTIPAVLTIKFINSKWVVYDYYTLGL